MRLKERFKRASCSESLSRYWIVSPKSYANSLTMFP